MSPLVWNTHPAPASAALKRQAARENTTYEGLGATKNGAGNSNKYRGKAAGGQKYDKKPKHKDKASESG